MAVPNLMKRVCPTEISTILWDGKIIRCMAMSSLQILKTAELATGRTWTGALQAYHAYLAIIADGVAPMGKPLLKTQATAKLAMDRI
jgi:hypothetical protein